MGAARVTGARQGNGGRTLRIANGGQDLPSDSDRRLRPLGLWLAHVPARQRQVC